MRTKLVLDMAFQQLTTYSLSIVLLNYLNIFIDFSKAFYSVWRIGLWKKLLNTKINGKFFNVIHNLCHNIKSCRPKFKLITPTQYLHHPLTPLLINNGRSLSYAQDVQDYISSWANCIHLLLCKLCPWIIILKFI